MTSRPRGWRTVKELAEELRFSTPRACRSWLRRQGIKSVKRGRVILVDEFDVQRALLHGGHSSKNQSPRHLNSMETH